MVDIKRKPQLIKLIDFYSLDSDKIKEGFWIRNSYKFTQECHIKCDINSIILFVTNGKYILFKTSLFDRIYYSDDILKEYQKRLDAQIKHKKNKLYNCENTF